MAYIYGTGAADDLVGTQGDDYFLGRGVPFDAAPEAADRLAGLNGADTYSLFPGLGTGPTGYPVYNLARFVIDDGGTDGALDRIEGVAGLVTTTGTAALTTSWAEVLRVGRDLVLSFPGDGGTQPVDVTIRGQFRGTGVELLNTKSSLSLTIADSRIGGTGADLLAGTDRRDVLRGNGGDDWAFGNGGNDVMNMGAGNDTALGGSGNDLLVGKNGDDALHGGTGDDRLYGGNGNDTLNGDAGADSLWGGKGNDVMDGGDGNDRLIGLAGNDILTGGAGDDLLQGGGGGDTYRFTVSAAGWGNDTLTDRGAGNVNYARASVHDVIEIGGVNAPGTGDLEATDALSFARSGNDLVISVSGSPDDIVIAGQLAPGRANNFIEELHIDGGDGGRLHFTIVDGARHSIGDDRDWRHNINSKLNEVLIGTDGDDAIFGGSGNNFILTGAGADRLIYKANDQVPFDVTSSVYSHDVVLDFDVARDRLDFTQLGIGLADLTIGSDADGDARISWSAGAVGVADIEIELRGVAAIDLTPDVFLF